MAAYHQVYDWTCRTGISSGTLRSSVEYGLPFYCLCVMHAGERDKVTSAELDEAEDTVVGCCWRSSQLCWFVTHNWLYYNTLAALKC